MATPSDDNVRYDILIEAKSALKSLQLLLRATESNEQKIIRFSQVVIAQSRQWGISWQQALNVYKQLNAELSKQNKPNLFGKTGSQDLLAKSEQYIGALAQSGKLATTSLNQFGQAAAAAGNAGEQAGKKTQTAFERTFGAINLVRIALGTLVAMLIFNVLAAFQNMVRGALKGLKEIEAATFNIVNAEKKLSEQGIEISVQGIEKLIADLQELDPMLSRFQATELVSTLATKVAPAFGFGTKEIERMAKAITVLAIRNQALGKSFEEVQQQVITGLLSGKVTAGINQLGLKITDQIVKEEAVALGLAKSAKAYDNLNAKAQERINILTIISILEKDTAQEAASLPAFLQTASGMIEVAKAQFQDILTTLGQKFAPVLKEVLRGIIQFLERINQSLIENGDAWNVLVTIVSVFARTASIVVNAFLEIALAVGKVGKALYDAAANIPIFGTLVKMVFPETQYPDTPTGIRVPDSSGEEKTQEDVIKATEKAQEKLQDILQDSADKKLDIERDYQRKLQDISRDYANKLVDIARDVDQKREDALRDYGQKVEDINRDSNQAIQDAQEDFRRKEIDREAEYQNRLRELRDKFLFDLEDALHERDARQVLRLIRQYNLDKKNLEERRNLQEQEEKDNLQRKIAEIERERQLKLEAAKRDYEEKLAEIAIGEKRALEEARIWQRRQLEDARLWHQRQLQEQREYLQRKLRDLAEALAQELNLTAAGAQALTSLLASYFGSTGQIPSLLSNFNNSLPGLLGGGSTLPDFGSTFNKLTSGHGYGFAEGGTLIATRPTKATFGERGPEAVTVTPLTKIGNNVGKVFGDTPSNQMGGSLSLRIMLQDGLIADIVETSLEAVSTHIELVEREK